MLVEQCVVSFADIRITMSFQEWVQDLRIRWRQYIYQEQINLIKLEVTTTNRRCHTTWELRLKMIKIRVNTLIKTWKYRIMHVSSWYVANCVWPAYANFSGLIWAYDQGMASMFYGNHTDPTTQFKAVTIMIMALYDTNTCDHDGDVVKWTNDTDHKMYNSTYINSHCSWSAAVKGCYSLQNTSMFFNASLIFPRYDFEYKTHVEVITAPSATHTFKWLKNSNGQFCNYVVYFPGGLSVSTRHSQC